VQLNQDAAQSVRPHDRLSRDVWPLHLHAVSSGSASFYLALDDTNLFRRQVVELIDQVVDLTVERGAFAFVESLVTFSARGREL
jgi:hypothetical protein